MRIRMDRLSVRNMRNWGEIWLGLQLWDMLELDGFWSKRLVQSRKGTDWLALLKAIVIYRLTAPGSELQMHERWLKDSAAEELFGSGVLTGRSTLYNCLVAMVDEMGRPIFQNNAQEGANGSVLGASIKLEEAVADGKLLVGDPKRVIGNVVQDIMVENDRDIQKHTVIYSAYARMQAALIDDQSFASLSLAE